MTICELCEEEVHERQKLDFGPRGDNKSMMVCKSCYRWMMRKLNNKKGIYNSNDI
jgi:hypothetical protein